MSVAKRILSPLLTTVCLLNLAACDKANITAQTNATASSTVATTHTVSIASTTAITPIPSMVTAPTSAISSTLNPNTTAATATIDQMMSIMGTGLAMANKMSQQTDGKAKFTAKQIDCVANTNNGEAVSEMQIYLQQNFNETEIQQMNDYFGSSAGKKQSQMTKNMIATLVKDSKGMPKIQPTAQEQKDIEVFWKSETGKKLETLLKDKEKLRPMMTKVMAKKQMDCNLPKS